MPMLSGLMRLLRDCRAVAAIEMAFALPITCALTFSMYEVTQGVICYMKIIDVANTVADLIGQTNIAQGGVGNTDFNNFYIAGQLIMTPSTGGNLKLAIASVYFDATGSNPVQRWHVERGGAAALTGTTTFASNLGTAYGSTIIVKATYSYSSVLNYFITTPINITAEVAAQPRNLIPPAYQTGIPCPPASGSQTCS
jgi:Flp pilus assembly protein TadG